MRHLILLAAVLAAPAHAQDTWTGRDKQKHFGASAAAGMACAAAIPSDGYAFACALVPGLMKEAYDAGKGRGASGKDVAWNALGAYVGLKAGRFVFTHANGRTAVTAATTF